MKKLIFVFLIACIAFVGCQAKEAEARGGDPCKSFLGSILNDCIQEDVDDPRAQIGVGADIPLWKNEKFDIDQETRLDLNGYGGVDEGDFATYTVVKPKMEKGILQTIGDFFANLFNKE